MFQNKFGSLDLSSYLCLKQNQNNMKKVNLSNERPDIVYLDDLKANQHIGFIDNEGYKGYLVYVGDGNGITKGPAHLHAVRSSNSGVSSPIVCNMSYGALHRNRHITPQKALNFKKRNICAFVKEVFVFDDRKELYLWLSL